MTLATGMGTIRVMVVEDHALVRAAVRQALSAADIEVVGESATAEDALVVALAVRPDVLLVDIDLPGMDGVSLVRELSPRLPRTRIVMLTVSRADRDIVDAVRAGATGYLTKDLAPDALQRAVRSAWGGGLAMPRQLAAHLIHRLVEASAHPTTADDAPLACLSARELEVLRLLASGLTDREIGQALTISPRTAETHVGNVLHKLGARNRADAARRYREPG
jgi:DNA-binding NarL/FixJ family response regulator